jgi:RHS repeat-associated protein
MTTRSNWLWVVGVVILTGLFCQAQQNATGRQAFGSFAGGPETINLGNLDVNLVVPILHRQGRGIPFVFDLTYDSSLVWLPVTAGGTTTWTPQPGWGWPVPVSAVGYVPSPVVWTVTAPCGLGLSETTTWRIYSGYIDIHGTLHHVPNLVTTVITKPPSCGGNSSTDASSATDDGSGYSISILHGPVSTASLSSRGGKAITVPIGNGTATLATDSNGNQITVDASLGKFYDTLSSTTPVLTVTGTSPINYTYTAPSGSPVNVVVSYKSYAVQTHFQCSGVTDYGASSPINNNLVDKITYPDGSFYQFTYEPTTTGSPNVTGRIKSVTLPTGGTISYAYTGSNGGINCADGTTMGFNRTTPDSSTAWQYSRSGTNPNWTTTVTDPVGTVTTYNMYQVTSTTTSGSASQATYTYYERNRTITGSLETILTCYNAVYSGCTTAALSLPFSQIDQYVTLGSKTSATETKFDTANGGRVTEVKQYDFGVSTGSAPSNTYLLKDTTISYAALTGILDHPYQVTVKDSAGTTKAQTTFAYSDTVTTLGGTPQHVAPSGSRGNATTVTSLTSGSSTLSKSFAYYDTGNVKTATDVNSAPTNYVYGSGTSCGNSFPTEVDLPLSLTMYSTWNCTGAVAATSTDVNGNTTTYQYTDPNYWRTTNIIFPDSASDTESISYDTGPTFPWKTTTVKAVDASNSVTTINWIDSLGRTYSVYRSDPNSSNNYNHVWIYYDALGRVRAVTNPYFTASEQTSGTTFYAYDALGRIKTITNPDSTAKNYSYTSRATEVTDEAGIAKVYQVDGLGRLVNVCDGVGAGAQANGPAPSTCAGLDISVAGFLATYAYDPLGNVTSATVGASTGYTAQTRSYTYDGLSRMLTETVPEIPTVSCGGGSYSKCYAYDTGSAGDLYTTTFLSPSGTSVNAQYTWDSLHRLTVLHYSDGSNGTGLAYDASSWLTWTLTNGKGRLTSQSHSNGAAAAYSYDKMGRPVWEGSCAGANCYGTVRGINHGYDYLGDVTAITTSSGAGITFSRNSIGQITGVTSSWNDSTHPPTLYSSATYNPFGELASGTYGDGITRTNSYDHLGRLTQVQDGTSGSTYQLTLGYQADGSVASANDSVNGNWAYTYDAFNRLATSTCTLNCPGSGSSEAYTYSYDQFGNRWKQHKTAGTGLEVDYTFNGNNRNTTSGFAYDSAGNLTSDGSCTPCWAYDDAGQLTSGNGATYLYDGVGRRQQKTDAGGTVHDFVFDGSTPYTEFTSAGFVRQTGGFYTYANGTTYIPHSDHLGTPRVTTDYTGTVQRTETNLAFGDAFSETASPFVDFTGFAGGFWDSENNGDHFGAREYAKTQGRWLTPDPAGVAAVDPMNPQTWNRYAYVGNNPATFVDPSGLKRNMPGPNPGPGMYAGGFTFGCGGMEDSGPQQFGANPFADNCDYRNPFSGVTASVLDQMIFDGIGETPLDGSGGMPCDGGEGLGLPCGMPLPQGSVWDILGITPPCIAGYNCGPSLDAEGNCTPLTPGCSNVPTLDQQWQHALGCDGNSLLDRGIRNFSLLRVGQTWPEYAIFYPLKIGAVQWLKNSAASAGASTIGFATGVGIVTGIGSLATLGATVLDASCFIPVGPPSGGPSPPWVPQ